MQESKDPKKEHHQDDTPPAPLPSEIEAEELDDSDLEDVPGGAYQGNDVNVWCDSGC